MSHYRVGQIGVGLMGAGISEYSGIECTPDSAQTPVPPSDTRLSRDWLSWLGNAHEDWRQPIPTITPNFIAEAFSVHPNTDLVAGADTNAATLGAFGQRYEVKNLYRDYREMLAKEQLDIVVVTTHTLPRARITIDAAKTPGVKGLYLEQPLATTLEEADQMVEVCASPGIPLTYHSFHPSFRTAKEIIDQGEIGPLKSVTTPSWRAKGDTNALYYIIGSEAEWAFGVMCPRGDITNTCCNYQLTLGSLPLKPGYAHRCSQCGGTYCENHLPPEAHRCPGSEQALRSWFDDCDCELNRNRGMIHFKNGVDCFVGTGETAASFICEDGVITIDAGGQFRLWKKVKSPPWAANRRVELPWPPPQYSSPNTTDGVEHLVRCMEDGSEPKVSCRSVRDAMEIEIALRESHNAGNVKLQLPLEDRKLRLTYRLRR